MCMLGPTYLFATRARRRVGAYEMGFERSRPPIAGGSDGERTQAGGLAPGKTPLATQPSFAGRTADRATAPDPDMVPPVQRKMVGPGHGSPIPPVQMLRTGVVEEHRDASLIAAHGVAGPGQALPHGEAIQRSFGHHDVSGVGAHVGGAAAHAAGALGAEAFATGNDVAFRQAPDLHTAAHEAAHVVQQRGGVQLKGGVGREGDQYEQHADAVADRVVRGESAETLLDQFAGGTSSQAVQLSPASSGAETNANAETEPAAAQGGRAGGVDSPQPGINKPGFIDNSEGANLRSGPSESGGRELTAQPLPPATRVFVSGSHKDTAQWLYVTAFLPDAVVRGYVQGFRVTTDLPEPSAKLYQLKGGETVEGLAKQEFSASVRDGHDLRYYENVLLAVNRDKGRAGIHGTFQAPNVFGGGDNNIQLTAGHRIWLVSPAYARSLEGKVPDGSLSNGMYAKAKRVLGHLEDILASVTESPKHFGAVAGEYAQAIKEHLPEIIGIVAGFIVAEAASAFLAATPTGVGQVAAVVIQLGLAAFGAAGMVQAGVQALGHAENWLTLAWSAHGKEEQISAASREFLRMLVAIAMAALAASGVKGNMGKATAIADSMPTMMPAFAVAGGGQVTGQAGAAVATGVPGPAGPLGTAVAMATKDDGNGGRSRSEQQGDAAREGSKGITAGSRVNMPAWRKIAIDMKHIRDRHMPGGKDLAPGNKKDIFLDMTEAQVEQAVRRAYRDGEVLHSQGDRVFVRGPFERGTIEMWVNRATKEIESAWPKY